MWSAIEWHKPDYVRDYDVFRDEQIHKGIKTIQSMTTRVEP